MNSEEMSYWLAYDRLDGVPDHPLLAGIITSNLFNAFTGQKTTPYEFIDRRRPVRIVSGDAGMAWFAGVAAANNAKIAREQAASIPIEPH